ncbi:MAG TPA: tRNA (cytidine(34)-2'-O)-methyltransferase [Acidimicrobiia bacterium]
MFNLVLYHPEIPPNTGNCMRLAANTGATLHLIEPLGFTLDDAKLRRAGMDYRDLAVTRVHRDLETWLEQSRPARVFALAKTGPTRYTEVAFAEGDSFLLGPESVGLPVEVLDAAFVTQVIHIPMQAGVRSLNLANAASIVLYEAWRQLGFATHPAT